MAKIVKKSDHLETEYKQAERSNEFNPLAFLLLIVICVAFVAAYFITDFPVFAVGAGIMFIVAIISVKSDTARDYSEQNILASGIEGEHSTAKLLKHLPDNYTVYQDVVVEFDGKVSEIDNVVVGRTGIFVIETKNRNSRIIGDYSERDWQQIKIGRGGTPYGESFYSPVKQVGTHIFRLKSYLRNSDIRVYINGAVYFSNPQASVEMHGEPGDVPVFICSDGGGEALLNYILSTDKSLPTATVKRINKIIENL